MPLICAYIMLMSLAYVMYMSLVTCDLQVLECHLKSKLVLVPLLPNRFPRQSQYRKPNKVVVPHTKRPLNTPENMEEIRLKNRFSCAIANPHSYLSFDFSYSYGCIQKKLLATENQNTKTRALPPMPGRNYLLALPVFKAKKWKCKGIVHLKINFRKVASF